MKKGMAVAIGICLIGLLVAPMGQAFADEKVSTRPADMNKAPGDTGDKTKDQKCDKIADADERNLCRAFTRDSYYSDQQKQNRYQNKDHSFYYCTLVKNTDKQKFCYAVVRNQKSMCGNIIDADLEKECNEKVK
ncbi:MAG: hypothetical protein G3M70_11265 [Candidatus Nitronauta litoralis]|uniref:Uncharacterized protein n=1 Tax=Candidatus Nitronauta litoralis TaxID=2705533 RepID=A0A7T0BWR0_9BACT|nr:MAG: hypothetical protein G3M70_11265 [Candidatus Nitronauta litoralis]